MGAASLALARTAKMPIGDLKMEGGGRGEGGRVRQKPFSGALRRRRGGGEGGFEGRRGKLLRSGKGAEKSGEGEQRGEGRDSVGGGRDGGSDRGSLEGSGTTGISERNLWAKDARREEAENKSERKNRKNKRKVFNESSCGSAQAPLPHPPLPNQK